MTTESKVSTTVDITNNSSTTNKKLFNAFCFVIGKSIDYGCFAMVVWVIIATMHN